MHSARKGHSQIISNYEALTDAEKENVPTDSYEYCKNGIAAGLMERKTNAVRFSESMDSGK